MHFGMTNVNIGHLKLADYFAHIGILMKMVIDVREIVGR